MTANEHALQWTKCQFSTELTCAVCSSEIPRGWDIWALDMHLWPREHRAKHYPDCAGALAHDRTQQLRLYGELRYPQGHTPAQRPPDFVYTVEEAIAEPWSAEGRPGHETGCTTYAACIASDCGCSCHD